MKKTIKEDLEIEIYTKYLDHLINSDNFLKEVKRSVTIHSEISCLKALKLFSMYILLINNSEEFQ